LLNIFIDWGDNLSHYNHIKEIFPKFRAFKLVDNADTVLWSIEMDTKKTLHSQFFQIDKKFSVVTIVFQHHVYFDSPGNQTAITTFMNDIQKLLKENEVKNLILKQASVEYTWPSYVLICNALLYILTNITTDLHSLCLINWRNLNFKILHELNPNLVSFQATNLGKINGPVNFTFEKCTNANVTFEIPRITGVDIIEIAIDLSEKILRMFSKTKTLLLGNCNHKCNCNNRCFGNCNNKYIMAVYPKGICLKINQYISDLGRNANKLYALLLKLKPIMDTTFGAGPVYFTTDLTSERLVSRPDIRRLLQDVLHITCCTCPQCPIRNGDSSVYINSNYLNCSSTCVLSQPKLYELYLQNWGTIIDLSFLNKIPFIHATYNCDSIQNREITNIQKRLNSYEIKAYRYNAKFKISVDVNLEYFKSSELVILEKYLLYKFGNIAEYDIASDGKFTIIINNDQRTIDVNVKEERIDSSPDSVTLDNYNDKLDALPSSITKKVIQFVLVAVKYIMKYNNNNITLVTNLSCFHANILNCGICKKGLRVFYRHNNQ